MKKIGLLSLALVLALGAMGGAIAYFSDTAIETKTFSAGTIDLQIRPAEDSSSVTCTGSWQDNMTWTIGPDWAPGDEVQECECMRNVGTTGGKMLKVSGTNASWDVAGLPDHIFITKIKFSEGGVDVCGNMVDYFTTVYGDGNAPLTLREFLDSYSMCFWEGTCTPVPPGQCVPSVDYISPGGGDIEWLCIGFTFDPAAGNEYQGSTLTFDLVKVLTDDCYLLGKGAGCQGYAE